MTPEQLRSALVEVSENVADLENYAIDLGTKLRQAEAERDRLAEQVERVRAIHVPHACPDPNCHQLGDCEQCGAPHPCATLTVALDGTEAGR